MLCFFLERLEGLDLICESFVLNRPSEGSLVCVGTSKSVVLVLTLLNGGQNDSSSSSPKSEATIFWTHNRVFKESFVDALRQRDPKIPLSTALEKSASFLLATILLVDHGGGTTSGSTFLFIGINTCRPTVRTRTVSTFGVPETSILKLPIRPSPQ